MTRRLHQVRGWRRRDQHGQAAVEFAIVLPFILLFAFFLIQGVQILTTWMTLEHASREGARYGAVRHTSSDIQTYTTNRSPTGSTVTVTGAVNQGGKTGTDVQVAVSYSYTPQTLNAFTQTFLKTSFPAITLAAQTHMRIEE